MAGDCPDRRCQASVGGVATYPVTSRFRLGRPVAATWRAEGVLQLGLDADGLVLEGVPAGIPAALAALSEPRTLAELGRLVPALSPAWLAWLVTRLDEAGLLTSTPAPDRSLGLVGSGPLADAVATVLHSTGLGRVVRIGHNPPRPRRVPATGLTPAPHWSQVTDGWPGLTVVATDTQEPDRCLTDALARAGRVHLITRLEADRAVVGPLVVPGATPCVRCQDLVRCRYDPSWPLLVAQLCRARAAVDQVLLGWAAATTVLQLRCHLAGGVADAVGRTVEVGPDHVLRTRDWPVHPECGCLLAVA